MDAIIPLERLCHRSPNPLPSIAIRDPELVEEVRQTGCRYYNECLTIAFRRDWEGFHCNECLSYSPYPLAQDYEGCAQLVEQLSQIAPFSCDDSTVLYILSKLGK